MVKRFGFERVSTNELVAQEIASGSRVGNHLEQLQRAGQLVPHDITMQLLRQAFENSLKSRFLIEGFPRTLNEAMSFEEHIGSCTQLLHLECPPKVLLQRF